MSALFPLTLEGAQTSRRGRVLVGPVSHTLTGAGATVILGPNGSGKTTLLRLMNGAARLTGGRIAWACPMADARRSQAFVFQRPVMLRRSVADNIAYPLTLAGMGRAEARVRGADWAGRVGLSGMLERQATVLSGGEQQKLALARALVTSPRVLFLDEPCASLDGRATREIEDILRAARDAGTALIMSTHDLGQARRLADEVIFLLHGQVNAAGAAQGFFDDPGSAEAAAFLKGDIVE